MAPQRRRQAWRPAGPQGCQHTGALGGGNRALRVLTRTTSRRTHSASCGTRVEIGGREVLQNDQSCVVTPHCLETERCGMLSLRVAFQSTLYVGWHIGLKAGHVTRKNRIWEQSLFCSRGGSPPPARRRAATPSAPIGCLLLFTWPGKHGVLDSTLWLHANRRAGRRASRPNCK